MQILQLSMLVYLTGIEIGRVCQPVPEAGTNLLIPISGTENRHQKPVR